MQEVVKLVIPMRNNITGSGDTINIIIHHVSGDVAVI
jgi:hypothetical protein